MITNRILKNATYILLLVGILFCLYKIFNWEIYPWIQLLLCFSLPLFSLLFSEMITSLKPEMKSVIIISTISQLALAIIVFTDNTLVLPYWRMVFFPSLFIILIITYSISLRKELKYHRLFKIITATLFIGLSLRFIYHHSFIDYAMETLFLIFIILIFRAKGMNHEMNAPSNS
jgi:hypothetical protein